MCSATRGLRLYAWASNIIRKLVIAVLRHGPVPQHIAFIMDGNRRFATKQGLKRMHGHQQGYLKLLDALRWSLDLGVKATTVYAFSIDNFCRGTDEVEALMTLAEQKLLELMENQELIETHQVQVRVLGDLSLLPARVQQAAAEAMAATHKHQGCSLNICMAYTSQQEMAQAVQKARQMVAAGSICTEDITADLLEQQLYTQGCPPVDLLIRTSGEHRLSDFLLWQSQFALLVFSDTLWPDYSFWDLLQALVQFQRSHPQLQQLAAQRHKQTDLPVPSLGLMPAKMPSAKHDADADQKLSEVFLHSPTEKPDAVRSDVDTSDSSVSSGSRPTSRSSSPVQTSGIIMELPQQQQRQQQQQSSHAQHCHMDNSNVHCCSATHQQSAAMWCSAYELHQLPNSYPSLNQPGTNLTGDVSDMRKRAGCAQRHHQPAEHLEHCCSPEMDVRLHARVDCRGFACYSKQSTA